MKREIAILDTSLHCCWLRIPGKETAGDGGPKWDGDRVDRTILEITESGGNIVLPLATIIETGNHISQAPINRFELATALCEQLRLAIRGKSPWIPFVEQGSFWNEETILTLANDWPKLAASRLSFADATIKKVADYYAAAGFKVTILTADENLRAYQPAAPTQIPRRNK